MNSQLQIESAPEPANPDPRLQILSPPPIQQSTNPTIHSARPRTRHGKIARLPHLERDMVNRMLQNNIRFSKIVGALDEHGFRVTERNVSNWKTRGGYKEW